MIFNDASEGNSIASYLADFFEISFVAVIAFDAKEKIMFWNPAAEQLYGWMASETLGKTLQELFGSVNVPGAPIDRSLKLASLKSGTTVRGEYSPYRKDGSLLSIEYKARAVSGPDDAVLGYVSVHHDLTERKRIENEIMLAAKMPAENPNPVMRMTPDGRVVYANNASEQLLNFWKRQTGQTISDDVRTAIHEVFESGSK